MCCPKPGRLGTYSRVPSRNRRQAYGRNRLEPLRQCATVPQMDLICYLHDGWDPDIRPAEPRRDWMDETPEAFAYRCLPLNIANAHGWEIGAAIG